MQVTSRRPPYPSSSGAPRKLGPSFANSRTRRGTSSKGRRRRRGDESNKIRFLLARIVRDWELGVTNTVKVPLGRRWNLKEAVGLRNGRTCIYVSISAHYHRLSYSIFAIMLLWLGVQAFFPPTLADSMSTSTDDALLARLGYKQGWSQVFCTPYMRRLYPSAQNSNATLHRSKSLVSVSQSSVSYHPSRKLSLTICISSWNRYVKAPSSYTQYHTGVHQPWSGE